MNESRWSLYADLHTDKKFFRTLKARATLF
ncbi:hypothetical protein HYPGJ_30340 [Hyphomicrobium sp. GJ21]|nr:hypothetical protein HYPGJ_30340 [Hyphomicrobium sp. GJ21]